MGVRNRHIFLICVSTVWILAGSASLAAPRSRTPRSPESCSELVGEAPQKLPKIEPLPMKRLDRLVDNPNFQYEMKYDGFRAVGYFEKDRRCRFISRNGNHLSRFQPLCESIAKELKAQNAIFDGELISPDPTGRPIFRNMLSRGNPFQYVAFDLLWLNGKDLRSLPLEARRRKLLRILPKSSSLITASLVQVGSGSDLYNLMVQHDLEGIVVKRLNDTYSRSTKWYKFKNKDYSQAKGRRHFF